MPLSLSLEELSKLWSVFFQTAYTLSVAYLATTVLIEPTITFQRPLPVRVRNITAFPFQHAIIDKVVSESGDHEPVAANDTVLIKGQHLAGAVRAVRVGEAELAPDPSDVTNTQISLTLAGAGLRAGLQAVQAIYTNGAESSVAPLVLRPRITVDTANVIAEEVPIDFEPSVGRRQRVILYLNEFGAPPNRLPRAFSFSAPSNNGIEDPTVESTTSITFAINDVPAGDYLVRVQVAGAESILTTDVTGRYTAPLATIP